MTLTTANTTTWTVATSAFDQYTAYMQQCEAIAEGIGFDYNPMIGCFYNAAGQRTNEFNVGYCAYFKGLHRAELPTHEMQLGFDEAHGEVQFSYAMMEDDYRNEPGHRDAWERF